MRKRFKYPLSFVGTLLCITLFVGICYFFFDRFNQDAVVIADDNLSINFIKGNKFDQKHNKELVFTIINSGESDIYYYISFSNVVGNANYSLKDENSLININDMLKTGVISSYVLIKPGEKQNYTLIFESDVNYSGTINVFKEAVNQEVFADVILKANKIRESKELNELTTSDEGLFISKDDNGSTYFFRGNIKNNYVLFANRLWRIVRINGDGSVRLILDNILDVYSAYYEGEEYSYKDSIIKNAVDNFYETSLSKYSDYISTTNYCNDIAKGESQFNAYNRVMTDNIISFNCLSDRVLSKIGLLTVDEAIVAGISVNKQNTSNYLYNEEIKNEYFLMSSAKIDGGVYYPFVINTNGTIITSTSGLLSKGVRPVINIIKNSYIDGEGTKDNPYILVDID